MKKVNRVINPISASNSVELQQAGDDLLTPEALQRVVGFFELLMKIDRRLNVTKRYKNDQDNRSADMPDKAA